ncbi:hypothetical protein GJ496_008623 [Pomphorhynchus laevis]|nr:hypothetical protein GJ496_008623 [Pomphorhynchus laevis]
MIRYWITLFMLLAGFNYCNANEFRCDLVGDSNLKVVKKIDLCECPDTSQFCYNSVSEKDTSLCQTKEEICNLCTASPMPPFCKTDMCATEEEHELNCNGATNFCVTCYSLEETDLKLCNPKDTQISCDKEFKYRCIANQTLKDACDKITLPTDPPLTDPSRFRAILGVGLAFLILIGLVSIASIIISAVISAKSTSFSARRFP